VYYILYPRHAAQPSGQQGTADLLKSVLMKSDYATHGCRHRVPHLLFKQASMSKSSTSSGNFMLHLFSHSSSKTNCCVV
jgi:hypothetical protein